MQQQKFYHLSKEVKIRMRVRICLILGLVVLVLIGNISNCCSNSKKSSEEKYDIFDMLECRNVDDLKLVIYYKSPFTLTRYPWDTATLIENCDYRIEVDGEKLEKYVDIFKQINNDVFVTVNKPSYEDVRICYTIENIHSGKNVNVALWGGNGNSIFVNGVEVEVNDIFYDVIMPFLEDDSVNELKEWIITQG